MSQKRTDCHLCKLMHVWYTRGVPTFFPPKIPAKAPARSWAGLNKAGGVVVWQQRSDILGHFHSKSDQRGLLCRVVRHVSSQLTRLSGDFGRKKCRDPYSVALAQFTMVKSEKAHEDLHPTTLDAGILVWIPRQT